MAKTAAARTAGAPKETAATAVATATATKATQQQATKQQAAPQATKPRAAPSAAPKAKSHYVARPQPYLEMLFKAGSFPSAQGTLLKHIFDYLKLDRVTTQHLPQLGPFVTCDAAACLYLNMLGMLVGEYNGLLKLGEYSRKLDLNAIFGPTDFTADSFNRQAVRLMERIALYDPARFAFNLACALRPRSDAQWTALTDQVLDELDAADESLAQAKAQAQAAWDQYFASHDDPLNAPRDPQNLPDAVNWVTITPQALAGILPYLKAITLEISLNGGGGGEHQNIILSCLTSGLPVIARLPDTLDEAQLIKHKLELNLLQLQPISVLDSDGKPITVQAALDHSTLELLDHRTKRSASLNLMVVDASEQRLVWRDLINAQATQEQKEMNKVLVSIKRELFPDAASAQAALNTAFAHLRFAQLTDVHFVAAREKVGRTGLGDLMGVQVKAKTVINKQACLDAIEHQCRYVLAYSPELKDPATIYNLFHNKIQTGGDPSTNFFTNHYYLIDPVRLYSQRALGTLAIIVAQMLQDALSAAEE